MTEKKPPRHILLAQSLFLAIEGAMLKGKLDLRYGDTLRYLSAELILALKAKDRLGPQAKAIARGALDELASASEEQRADARRLTNEILKRASAKLRN